MIPVEAAIAAVVAAMRPLPAEVVGLEAAHGRVLCAPVAARLDQPPSDVSAMDGYAVRSTDVATPPVSLRLVGESVAGAGFAGTVGPGAAARILTGAPMPEGADTVVVQENCRRSGDRVLVEEASPPGRHVRQRGGDFARDEVLLRPGRRLSPRDVGLAAAMNVPWLAVRRRPRVAILAGGDELALPGEPLGPGRIVASAGLLAAAWLREWGAEPLSLGVAADDRDALAGRIDAAHGCDLLITIGGASVGDRDLVRPVLDAAGLDLAFHGVAMRPGKPLLFGRLGDLAVLGLPGNPVSAGVTLLLFARAAVEALLGLPPRPALADGEARLGRDLPANGPRADFLRARLAEEHEGPVATPYETQDSAALRRFADADCLVVRPAGAPAVASGSRVPLLHLRQSTN